MFWEIKKGEWFQSACLTSHSCSSHSSSVQTKFQWKTSSSGHDTSHLNSQQRLSNVQGNTRQHFPNHILTKRLNGWRWSELWGRILSLQFCRAKTHDKQLAMKCKFESYCNGLFNEGFVNVGKSNFLSKELDIERSQRCTDRPTLPLRKLWKQDVWSFATVCNSSL